GRRRAEPASAHDRRDYHEKSCLWCASLRDRRNWDFTLARQGLVEFGALAIAERNGDRQPLEMLIDKLVPQADLVLFKEGIDLGLTVEQADDGLAHPR